MSKSKTVRAKQELVDRIEKKIEKPKYKSLAEFVSEATQQKLERLVKKRPSENLGRHIVGIRELTCINAKIHKIQVVRYDDSSIWVNCPMFGWFEEPGLLRPRHLKLGCRNRKKRCTWFIG